MRELDHTHDPGRRSWVESSVPGTDFPLQNLPLGVFRRVGQGEEWRAASRIGESVVDLLAMARGGLLGNWFTRRADLFVGPLNRLMGAGPTVASRLRRSLSEALDATGSVGRDARRRSPVFLHEASDVELRVPADVGDYTDFYASISHATNLGSMFRPDNPLLPNYKWVPIGYHGRASSIVVSGTDVRRPRGQVTVAPDGPPRFGPSERLDYEAELGFFVGRGNALGETIPIAAAQDNLFGVCLLNDWSARDVQAWEYQPLGPFLAKNFATTVSPWIVTWDALRPFRAPAYARGTADPTPLPYLYDEDDQATGGLAISLTVELRTARMHAEGLPPVQLSRARASDLYWTPAQLLAHHASNGCNLQPGDLLGSGTISGPTKESRGSLIELTWRGAEPLTLPTGETRRFLEDGDEVLLRGRCERDGFVAIGLGTCSGRVIGCDD
jgi:fumarylacetoacetase